MQRAFSLGDLTPGSEGAMAGKIAGSFIPIPGGSMIGSMVGSILGGLIGGKPSNDTAYAWFTAGPIPQPWNGPPAAPGGACQSNVCGDEKTSQTAQMGAQATAMLVQLVSAAHAQGYSFNSPAFIILIGTRDPSSIRHGDHSGQTYATAIGNPGDPAGAAMGAFHWLSQFASPAMTNMPPPPPSIPLPAGQPPLPQPSPLQQPVDSTAPVVGGTDYHSVQQNSSAVQTSAAPAPVTSSAGAGGVMASFASPPFLIFAVCVVAAVVVGKMGD